MIVVIDNYDSFVYNIAQYLGAVGTSVQVRRNDAVTIADVSGMSPAGVVISPGPCGPADAGISVDVVRHFAGRIPVLGVCLGHQAVGYAFGAVVRRAVRPMHGKLSPIRHDGRGLFAGLASPIEAVRYHSLVLDRAALPPCVEVSAVADDGEVMGIRHRLFAVEGVQFHPESVFTPRGLSILANFVRACDRSGSPSPPRQMAPSASAP